MKLKKLILISTLMLSISGCSIFGGDDSLPVNPSPELSQQFPLKERWSESLSGNSEKYSLLTPKVIGNAVYVAGRDGEVKALSLSNGKRVWTTDLAKGGFLGKESAQLSGGVGGDDQFIYVGSEKGFLYAIERETGKLAWKQEIKGEVLSIPVSDAGKVIIHTSNGLLQARDRLNGNLVWQAMTDVQPLTIRGKSTPSIANGIVVVGDSSGHVDAYSLESGALLWQQRIALPTGTTEIARLVDIATSPVIENNTVYIIGYNGYFTALDLQHGDMIWQTKMGASTDFTINGNVIYLSDQNGNVYALSKDNGAILWQQDALLNRGLTAPVVDNQYVAVGDFEGYLYLLDKTNGKLISKDRVNSSGLLSNPISTANMLIIQAKNGNVYAYGN